MTFKIADRVNYAPHPGGSSQQVQFNDDGDMNGAGHVTIDDSDLVLTYSSAPSTPDTDTLKLVAGKLSGKLLPQVKPPIGSSYFLQPFIGQRRIQQLFANGDSTTVTQVGTTVSTVGTVTAAATATTNAHTASKRVEVAVTVAATTAVAGLRTAALQHFMGTSTLGGYFLILRYGPSRGVTTASHRSFAGMWGSSSAPTDVNPSTLTDIVGFGYDSADTNFQFFHNDASGTAVKVDMGVSFPKPALDTTKVYEAVIYVPPGGPDVYYQLIDVGTGVSSTVSSVATEIPAASTGVRPVIYNSAGGTSSVIGVSFMNMYLESSY